MFETILYEDFLVNSVKRESKLKYLDEYLIESNGISLTESKELIKLVIQEGKYDFQDLVKKYNTVTKKIDKVYYKMKDAAKGNEKKLAKIENWRKMKMDKAYATHNKYLDILKKKNINLVDKIKIAARKAPKGKVGLATAGIAATAGGGYYAYKKYKNKNKEE